MPITPIHFTWEDIDGLIHGPYRVTAADKIGAEATCRNQGWPWADNPRVHSVMGYYATRRLEGRPADYDTFMATVLDFTLSTDDQEPAQEDPTRPAAGPVS